MDKKPDFRRPNFPEKSPLPSAEDVYQIPFAEVEIHLQDVKYSRAFESKPKLQLLLERLFKATERRQNLDEKTIAAEIFDQPDFRPLESSLVRVQINNLSEVLKAYYDDEGADSTFQFYVAIDNGFRLELLKPNIENRIFAILKNEGVDFTRSAAFRGVTCDFLVRMANESLLLIEAKNWKPTEANQARAISQARLLKDATGADDVMVVLPGLPKGNPSKGLYSESELKSFLLPLVATAPLRHAREERLIIGNTPSKIPEKGPVQIFAAMPFDGKYDDTYFVAMAHAAACVSGVCNRVDHEEFSSDIVERIKSMISSSQAVISDLSESKPNVLYETGFAHALRLPIVHICSTPIENLPFDVRNWNTLHYEQGQTSEHKRRRMPSAVNLLFPLRDVHAFTRSHRQSDNPPIKAGTRIAGGIIIRECGNHRSANPAPPAVNWVGYSHTRPSPSLRTKFGDIRWFYSTACSSSLASMAYIAASSPDSNAREQYCAANAAQ